MKAPKSNYRETKHLRPKRHSSTRHLVLYNTKVLATMCVRLFVDISTCLVIIFSPFLVVQISTNNPFCIVIEVLCSTTKYAWSNYVVLAEDVPCHAMFVRSIQLIKN